MNIHSYLQEVDNFVGNGIDPHNSNGKTQPRKYLENTDGIESKHRVNFLIDGYRITRNLS